MARIETLDFLTGAERLRLNQITGNGYMSLLAEIEHAVIAFSIRQAQIELSAKAEAARAFVHVAAEEFKHRLLFERYSCRFHSAFGTPCETLNLGEEISEAVSSRGSLPAVLVTLHLELLAEQHHSRCHRAGDALDPLFDRILEAHWREESRHARIDMLELVRAVAVTSDGAIDGAIHDYLQIVERLGDILARQADLDVRSLSTAVGRSFSDDDVERLVDSRSAAYRGMFVVSGMLNPRFLEAIRRILPEGPQVIEKRAKVIGSSHRTFPEESSP